MRNWRTSSIRSSNRAGAMAILTVMMLLLALLSLCLGAEMVNPGKILAELLEGGRDSAAVRIFLYVRLPDIKHGSFRIWEYNTEIYDGDFTGRNDICTAKLFYGISA